MFYPDNHFVWCGKIWVSVLEYMVNLNWNKMYLVDSQIETKLGERTINVLLHLFLICIYVCIYVYVHNHLSAGDEENQRTWDGSYRFLGDIQDNCELHWSPVHVQFVHLTAKTSLEWHKVTFLWAQTRCSRPIFLKHLLLYLCKNHKLLFFLI